MNNKKNIFLIKFIIFLFIISQAAAYTHIHADDCYNGAHEFSDCLLCNFLYILYSSAGFILSGFIIYLQLCMAYKTKEYPAFYFLCIKIFRNKAPPVFY